MRIRKEVLPIKEGEVSITFSEVEIKNILLDLESESKHHRESTELFKNIVKYFLERCKR